MWSSTLNPRPRATARPTLARFSSPAAIGAYLARLWLSNRERRQLAELDDRLLRDIGLDPAAAAAESERPFWELSAHHEAALRRQFGN